MFAALPLGVPLAPEILTVLSRPKHSVIVVWSMSYVVSYVVRLFAFCLPLDCPSAPGEHPGTAGTAGTTLFASWHHAVCK